MTIMRKPILSAFVLVSLFCSSCAGTSVPSSEPAPAASPEPTASASGSAAEKDSETIVILHTNDVHCAVNDKIGYDGLYLYREEVEQKYENVLLVDAGDAIQGGTYGTLSKGSLIVDLMNAVGYDVAIPGNHEFDYGFEILDDLSEELKCGYTCANFCTSDGETVFEPYKIIETAGKKIAFIGIDTPSTFTKSRIHTLSDDQGLPMYDFLADETGDRLAECLQKNVDEVREKGADIVILMAHLGNGADDEKRYHSEAIIAKTNGIDVLIDAHDHSKNQFELLNKDGEKVICEETGTKLQSIGQIMIHPDNTITTQLIEEVPEPEGIEAELVTRGKSDRWVDSSMKKMIETEIASYDDVLNRKIGKIAFDIPITDENDRPAARRHETALMDLVTDAMLDLGESELALYYGGGAKAGIIAGDITFADLVSAFPYSNDILVVTLKGQDLLDALEFGARKLPEENNALLHGSGLTYTVDLSVPSSVKEDATETFLSVDGPYRVKDVMIAGEPLDPEREYLVTMNNYLQGGGDGMAMMRNTTVISYAMMVENEALADYIEYNLNGEVPEKYAKPDQRLLLIGQ